MTKKYSKNMKSNLLIIILVIISVVLGILIIKPSGLKLPSFEKKISQSSVTNTNTSASTTRKISANLSEEEKKLFKFPPPGASTEEIKAHVALGAKFAKEADTLEISDCEPQLLVLRVKEKTTFKVTNNDTTDHILIIDEEHKYPIAAGETTTIKADFGKPPGLYGYDCERVGPTGFIFVEP